MINIQQVNPWQTRSIKLPLAIVLGFLAISCSPNKVQQCREIGKIIADTDQQMRTITDSGRKKDHSTLLKAAELMETSAQDLQNLKLADSQLKTLQTQLQKVYQDTGKTTRILVTSLQKKDSKIVNQTLDQLLKILKQQNQTLTGIKNYCTANPEQS